MHISLKTTGLLAVGLVAMMTGLDDSSGGLGPAAAKAADVVCTSTNYQYSYCGAGIGKGRPLVADQYSKAPCDFGRSWGYDRQGIWVDRGCAARFKYSSGGGGTAGALIVGGIIGAMLASGGDNHHDHDRDDYHRDDRYNRPYPVYVERHHDRSQDADPTVQKFDKDGNPNYDERGNYQGPHGIGALVDNPDSGNDDSSDSNPDGSGGEER